MNVFYLAHSQRGTLSDPQLRALDTLLAGYGRARFDRWRAAVGIRPGTANQRLSRRDAWRLMQRINAELEGER